MLPRCVTILRAHVITRKRYHEGNRIGHANHNPILDLCQYDVQVQFDGDGASELTATISTDNIYGQCDPDGNQYAILDSLLYFRHYEPALTFAAHKIVGGCC